MVKMLQWFDDPNPMTAIKEVGGKGYSLVQMSHAGLNVPPGFVLTVDFFDEWNETILSSKEWHAFIESPLDASAGKAEALPPLVRRLKLNSEQSGLIEQALARLDSHKFFAVRSSSPEEDLAGASFAGEYETVLGVTRETMLEAVRQAYASCLSPRVFVYKRRQGFSVNEARIAVVVQAQIASEVAGVGFSIEPISNDYDQAVFNANWGLGETVVSGLASPDQYVVDKITGRVLESVVGKKETSIWLEPDGGTVERPDPRSSEPTLTEAQLASMTDQLLRIEELYQRPMDIEWAWENGNFYLLQARPITTHLPLPEELITQPGEPRRLYLDATLASQGITEPLSVMGLDYLHRLFAGFSRALLGNDKLVDEKEGLIKTAGGRIYAVYSHIFHLARPKKTARLVANMDNIAAQVLSQLDDDDYLSDPKPDYLNHFMAKIAFHIPDLLLKGLEAALIPDFSAERYQRKVKETLQQLKNNEGAPERIDDYADWLNHEFTSLLIHTVIPPMAASFRARAALKKIFSEKACKDAQIAHDLEAIDQSLPHNITIKMGLDLYKIAEELDKLDIQSIEDLKERFEHMDLPADIAENWQRYLRNFGFRGPKEMDLASSRYVERPDLLVEQLNAYMALDNEKDNPRTIYERSVAGRLAANQRLSVQAHKMGLLIGKKYDLLYRLVEHFGGYRENHKYFLIMINYMLRERVVLEGRKLVQAGRLNRMEQVFDLKLADLARAMEDPGLDLQAIIADNTRFTKQLPANVQFPHLIDSRGRILRPTRPAPTPGQLSGQPISPGSVEGRVNVLHTPDEKPLLPGEILVARATDPGWTPLFVNAAAIVLEVGGMLQHGALVAREYGKPCIAGVENATSRLKDGELVEVDGSTGIIYLKR